MAPSSQSEKLAVITGGSGGIGEAFAYELGRDGYKLVLISRDDQELNRVAGTITSKLNISAIAIPKDLSHPDAAKEIDEELERRNLVPDVLINNAGYGLLGNATDVDADEQLAMIDLNVRATTELSVRCGTVMKRRGHGGIINVSSVAGYLPGPRMAVYYASKAYVKSFTEAFHFEMKPFGVTVTCVCPGITKTDFQRRAGLEDTKLMSTSPPMTPEQVAKIGYAGFKKGKRLVLTGVQNQLSAYASHLLPNGLLLPVVNSLHK